MAVANERKELEKTLRRNRTGGGRSRTGTGKTLAAEALGYDLGCPLKVVNSSALISKWVGESAKNIEAVFDDAAAAGALLVFDEAEALFGSRASSDGGGSGGRHDSANVGVLLHRVATYPGVVVAITNLRGNIDAAFDRRFTHIIEFPRPDAALREQLWRKLLPASCPRSSDVSGAILAQRYELTGGQIRAAVLRAATRAVACEGVFRFVFCCLRASPSTAL